MRIKLRVSESVGLGQVDCRRHNATASGSEAMRIEGNVKKSATLLSSRIFGESSLAISMTLGAIFASVRKVWHRSRSNFIGSSGESVEDGECGNYSLAFGWREDGREGVATYASTPGIAGLGHPRFKF
jgi:hypothetical protein